MRTLDIGNESFTTDEAIDFIDYLAEAREGKTAAETEKLPEYLNRMEQAFIDFAYFDGDGEFGITWSTTAGGSFAQTGYDFLVLDDAVEAGARGPVAYRRQRISLMLGDYPVAGQQVWAAIETRADVVMRVLVDIP